MSTMPMTSGSMKSLLALAIIIAISSITTTTITATKTGTGGEDWPGSVELADLRHTETVIIENLRNYVNALDSKIGTIKRKTQQIRAIYDVALNDTNKYFGNPINTYNLIKRMAYEWEAIRNLAGKDVTGHIVENITEFSEFLTFPTEQDLDEAVGKLLKIQDVYQMDSSQVAMGEFNGMKFGSQMTWSDCLAIGQQSFRQGEHLVAKVWLQTALEKLPTDGGKPLNNNAKVEILETMSSSEFQSGNIKEAVRLTEEILSLSPKNKRAIAALSTYKAKLKRKSLKPRKVEPKKTKPAEELLVEEVCRGNSEQYTSSYRTCTLVSGNIPFQRIAPVRLETVSVDPFIAIYHKVFSHAEIDDFKDALVSGGEAKKYNGRLEAVTGYGARSFSSWTTISSHFYDEIDLRPNIAAKGRTKGSGVVWIQLNEPKLGGAIAFPQLELKLSVPKGSLVYWSTVNEFKEVDYRTKQFTCPVIAGSLEAATALIKFNW